MKTDLFQFCGHCWVFQICWHIECSTFRASSFRIWNSSTGTPSPPLALSVPGCLCEWSDHHGYLGSWRSFLYSSSVYSCHLFLIASASVRSIPFLSFCQENALAIANTLFQQHKRRLYTWRSPDGQHQNQIDYILCRQRWRSSIQLVRTRQGADCDSDHELLIAKFRLKLKKVGKTTRPFRYDLNKVPYDYTVEVTNRFKGLDLIERLPDELWTEVHDIVQETGIKTTPKKKKCKKAKWLSEEALQIAVKRREVKGKGEKERYTHLNAEFQRISRRDKKAFFSDQCKEIEEKK